MDNDICAICLDNNNEDKYVCMHRNNIFHNSCIKKMNNSLCPLCRKNYKIICVIIKIVYLII